jgi:rhodanese-related sulfurtransferase
LLLRRQASGHPIAKNPTEETIAVIDTRFPEAFAAEHLPGVIRRPLRRWRQPAHFRGLVISRPPSVGRPDRK